MLLTKRSTSLVALSFVRFCCPLLFSYNTYSWDHEWLVRFYVLVRDTALFSRIGCEEKSYYFVLFFSSPPACEDDRGHQQPSCKRRGTSTAPPRCYIKGVLYIITLNIIYIKQSLFSRAIVCWSPTMGIIRPDLCWDASRGHLSNGMNDNVWVIRSDLVALERWWSLWVQIRHVWIQTSNCARNLIWRPSTSWENELFRILF